jgi:formamidopyrimidine-DNA glycosylase
VPEIPELEVLKENLQRLIEGKVLKQLRIIKPYVQKTTVPGNLIGQKVTGITRRGKYITIDLEDHRLIIHLMLRGRFKPLARGKQPYKTAAALLEFEGASIQLVEDAKLKRMSLWIVEKNITVDDIKPLGVEPLSDEFTHKRLEELIANSSERLKNFLLNQHNIAGIGNAYADEICWRAGLSPFKQAAKLDKDEITRLYSAIGETLVEATEETRKLTGEGDEEGKEGEGIEINEERPFMAVHRRRGKPCPRCGRKVEWVSTTLRDTFYCPNCQTEGRVLKDGRTSRFLKGG